jgi:hypothetical protein
MDTLAAGSSHDSTADMMAITLRFVRICTSWEEVSDNVGEGFCSY